MVVAERRGTATHARVRRFRGGQSGETRHNAVPRDAPALEVAHATERPRKRGRIRNARPGRPAAATFGSSDHPPSLRRSRSAGSASIVDGEQRDLRRQELTSRTSRPSAASFGHSNLRPLHLQDQRSVAHAVPSEVDDLPCLGERLRNGVLKAERRPGALEPVPTSQANRLHRIERWHQPPPPDVHGDRSEKQPAGHGKVLSSEEHAPVQQ